MPFLMPFEKVPRMNDPIRLPAPKIAMKRAPISSLTCRRTAPGKGEGLRADGRSSVQR